MIIKKLPSLVAALVIAQLSYAKDYTNHLALTHAPIGVMGDHTHNKGEWMFSYRYMDMSMDGLRRGTNDLQTAQALQDFMLVPVKMDMQMQMLGVMYAPTERITLMGMLNHQKNDMLLETRMGNRFTTSSEGMGDSKLGTLISLKKWNNNYLHANLGISLPTGSINVRDVTPMGPNTLLPYPMRIGSGTYDLSLGLTWNQYHETYSLGAQLMSTLRTGENDQDYRLGHENKLNFWAAKSLNNSWSLSARLEAKNRQSIKGSDPRLMMAANMTPTANADFTGGDFAHLSIGLTHVSNVKNWTNGHRLAIEFSQPVLQNLAGTQMKLENSFTIGWQKAF